MNWKPWKTRCHEIVLLLDILEGHTQLSRSTTCLVQVENASCDTFLKASDASACATKDSWHLESCWRALNDYCSIWSSRSSLPAHTANAEKPRIFEVHSGSLWNKFERLCFAAICYLYVAVLTNWYKRTCVLGSVPNPATTWNWELHCYFKIRFLCSLWLWSLLHLVNLLHKDRRESPHLQLEALLLLFQLPPAQSQIFEWHARGGCVRKPMAKSTLFKRATMSNLQNSFTLKRALLQNQNLHPCLTAKQPPQCENPKLLIPAYARRGNFTNIVPNISTV